MRLIDADDAIERLGAYLMADAQIEWGGAASEDIEDWKELAGDILKGTPSTEIVCCRQCIHCADDWNGNQPMFTCELGRCGESVQPNDFCSYGCREEREGE